MSEKVLTYIIPRESFSETDTQDNLYFTSDNLPEWISFNPLANVFSGTPTCEYLTQCGTFTTINKMGYRGVLIPLYN